MAYIKRFYILLFLCALPAIAWAYTSDDYFHGALTYYQQKNYDQAIRYLKIVVQNDPNNWQAYQILGNCYHDMHDDVSALAAYDKSLAANPNNPGLKAYADNLRAASPTPTPPPETKEKAFVREYYEGKDLQEHARTELAEYGKDHPLGREDRDIVSYGIATCARDDHRFQIGLNFLGPTLVGLDAGLSLDPTTNLGLTGIYIPGSLFGESSSSYYALEPRIKFYSSPKDATFFFGFGVVFGAANDGSSDVNSSWIGPNFKFGLSLVDSNGLYFELDWSVGAIIESSTTTTTTFDFNTQNYTNSSSTTGTALPALIPSLRIGLAL